MRYRYRYHYYKISKLPVNFTYCTESTFRNSFIENGGGIRIPRLVNQITMINILVLDRMFIAIHWITYPFGYRYPVPPKREYYCINIGTPITVWGKWHVVNGNQKHVLFDL